VVTAGKAIWRDGELIPWDEATVHVLSHALHYGSGVFEGIRAYRTGRGTAVFRLTDHMRRLHRSAEACRIPLRWGVVELAAAAKQVLAANDLDWGYIRPIAFYEAGGLGVLPRDVRVATMIAAWQWGAYLGEHGVRDGIRVRVSPWRRFGPAVLPQAKVTGGYVNSMLAKIDAVRAGYDEAIMLGPDGSLSEGTGENLFIIQGGVVHTPPLSSGCLDGITRHTVMTLLAEKGFPVVEEDLALDRLFEADEVLLTGTAAEVTPVREVDDRPVGDGRPGPITRRAQELFAALVDGEDPRHQEWLEYL
jgi:branched-chain amino acid aminotransferase